MVLPPQVRDYWAALQAEKKVASEKDRWLYAADPFEAASSRAAKHVHNSLNAPPPSLSNASDRKPNSSATYGRDAPEVHMSMEMRSMVHTTIRAMRHLHPPTNGDSSIAPYAISAEEQKQVVQNLCSLGYREGHVKSAIDYIQSTSASSDPLLEGRSPTTLKETLLQYLQITLSEEELPARHGYTGRPDTGLRIAKHGDAASLAEVWLVEKVVKEAGYPIEAVMQAIKTAQGKEGIALDILARQLVGWHDKGWTADDLLETTPDVDLKDLAGKRAAEIEALESLLGKDFRRLSTLEFELDLATSQPVSIRVLFSEYNCYPSPSRPSSAPHLPTFFVTSASSSVPSYIRLHLTSLLLARFRDPESPEWRELLEAGEGGVLYEMSTYLAEVAEEVLRDPPPASEVLRYFRPDGQLGEAYEGLAKAGRSVPTQNAQTHRTRTTGDSNDCLLNDFVALQETPGYQSMLEKRKRLPAWAAKASLISLIRDNRVVVVSGATGSGKTTQVPAFVLEDAILRGCGGATSIICTQPRRISAIGVAGRVAQERNEKVGENLVGYAIRGERKASRKCKLLFCTTGIRECAFWQLYEMLKLLPSLIVSQSCSVYPEAEIRTLRESRMSLSTKFTSAL